LKRLTSAASSSSSRSCGVECELHIHEDWIIVSVCFFCLVTPGLLLVVVYCLVMQQQGYQQHQSVRALCKMCVMASILQKFAFRPFAVAAWYKRTDVPIHHTSYLDSFAVFSSLICVCICVGSIYIIYVSRKEAEEEEKLLSSKNHLLLL